MIAPMDTAAPPTFDPYHKWLGIRDFRSAPNHYRLLGLELFENDEDVIREAASRQTVHLKNYRAGPHKKLCEQILEELAHAKETLLDEAKKTSYDRTLRTQLGSRGGEGSRRGERGVAATIPTGTIECPGCGVENSTARQFCSGCGLRLWEPCIQCGELNLATEKHCGSCGGNLAQQLEQARESLKAKFSQAAELREDYRHAEAIDLLHAVEVPDHSALAKYRGRLTDTLAKLQEDISRAETLREDAMTHARELLAKFDYEQAALTLEQIAESYRTDAHRELLEQVRSRQVEVLTLVSEIRQAVQSKQTEGLLPKVEDLLRLKPDHQQAQSLAAKLRPMEQKKQLSQRDALVQAAQALLAKHNYAGAVERLEQIPPSAVGPELEKLLASARAKADETSWLAGALKEAVGYDEHLLPIAERLQKLRPNDAEVAKIIELLKKRAGLGRREQLSFRGWPKPPATSAWGGAVERVTGYQNFLLPGDAEASGAGEGKAGRAKAPSAPSVSTADAAAATIRWLTDQPERFCVALGLALAALQRGWLGINLVPPEKATLLGGLFKGKKRAIESAWGIDVGRAGLRAVKLVWPSDAERPTIAVAECLEYGKLLNQPDVEGAELLHAALDALIERQGLKDGAICVSLPLHKMLYRSLTLPLLDRAKIPDLMKYEARTQIPFPLEEVCWDFQILSEEENPATDLRQCEVALAGLRRTEAAAQLAPFADRGIKVDILTPDAVGLANFHAHESWLGKPAGKKTGDPSPAETAAGKNAKSDDAKIDPGLTGADVAPGGTYFLLLDSGTDSTNLVLGNQRTLLMRAIPVGGNAFSKILVKDFQLTFAQAEKLKRTPTAVRELHRLYGAIEPRFCDLVREVHRSVESFLEFDRSRRIERVLAVGGTIRFHGLLRHLWLGKR